MRSCTRARSIVRHLVAPKNIRFLINWALVPPGTAQCDHLLASNAHFWRHVLAFRPFRALLGPLVALLGYQMVSDANFPPRIHFFVTYLSFAHQLLPKTWPTFGCKRFFRPKLSPSSPSFPFSRDLLIDLPLIYSSTCVHLSMKLSIYLSFLSSNAYNMLWVAGGICIIQNAM